MKDYLTQKEARSINYPKLLKRGEMYWLSWSLPEGRVRRSLKTQYRSEAEELLDSIYNSYITLQEKLNLFTRYGALEAENKRLQAEVEAVKTWMGETSHGVAVAELLNTLMAALEGKE